MVALVLLLTVVAVFLAGYLALTSCAVAIGENSKADIRINAPIEVEATKQTPLEVKRK